MAATTAPAPAPAPAPTPAPTPIVVPVAPLAPATPPLFNGDPYGATEAAFPNYPQVTTPDPAATAAESTSPIAPK